MVGVAPSDFDINSSSWNTCGWYFYCYNSTLYSGPPFNYSNKGTNLSKVDNEIIVVMNIKKRTLKFIINNDRIYTLSGDNKNILTKTGNGGWMGTICEYELDKSIEEHKWKIKILKTTQNKWIFVGVAPSDFDINSSDWSTCGWYFYCYDSCLYSGPPFNYNGKQTNLAKVDNEIVIIMNMKKRSLKFVINGEDKGDSYTNIPLDKPIYPAVLLCDLNDSVKIIDIQ